MTTEQANVGFILEYVHSVNRYYFTFTTRFGWTCVALYYGELDGNYHRHVWYCDWEKDELMGSIGGQIIARRGM